MCLLLLARGSHLHPERRLPGVPPQTACWGAALFLHQTSPRICTLFCLVTWHKEKRPPTCLLPGSKVVYFWIVSMVTRPEGKHRTLKFPPTGTGVHKHWNWWPTRLWQQKRKHSDWLSFVLKSFSLVNQNNHMIRCAWQPHLQLQWMVRSPFNST